MSLTFLPWLRAGLVSQITAADGAGDVRNRAAVQVGVKVNETAVPVQQVHLLGPGDVIGIDSRQVIRTDPPNGAPAHEPSRFVSVELDEPHLPWQFTPAAPPATQRLRPWIVLAVVRLSDGVALEPGLQAGATVLRIQAPARVRDELPDLAQSWAFAHAQMAGSVTAATLPGVLASAPERSVSRLLCARTLDAGAAYAACIIPAFAAGRDAGLGRSADPNAALLPAWNPDDAEAQLPVYYSWRFSTGEKGDFASLAAALRPSACPPGVGVQRLDLAPTGLESAGRAPLTFAGVLRAPRLNTDPGPSETVREKLAAATATDATAGDLPAPLYAAGYAGAASVAPTGAGWLAELNLDPRARVAAALGARVVANRQEDLVSAAWEQAGAVDAADATLNRARLARAVAGSLRDRHLETLAPEVLLQVTAPAHGRMRASPETVRARIADSALPDAVMSAAFRRLSRPRGPIMRRVLAPHRGTSRGFAAAQDGGSGAAASPAAAAWQSSGLAAIAEDGTATAPRAFAAAAAGTIAASVPTKAALLERLDAERTIPARVLPRLRLEDASARTLATRALAGTPDRATDPLGRVLVAPSFPTPMYGALADVAPDHVLPGAGQIAPNAVLLLEADRGFVAAFMAGLNHELGREFVWRGFPLERRATFFRQFWDFRGQAAGTPDVPPLSQWAPDAPLGSLVTGAGAADPLVLLIRGDLLRRYPRTLVYALRATRTSDGKLVPSADTTAGALSEPSFSGFLAPDIRFFGFQLKPDAVRSTPTDTGWFFVLQEQPVESRFGLADGQTLVLAGTGADVALATIRPRIRVAIHADDVLSFE